MYTWAKAVVIFFLMVAFGSTIPHYGAMIAYRKWAKNYDEQAHPQPPTGDAAVPSEWNWNDMCLVPCVTNIQTLIGFGVIAFVIDGIVSLTQTSNACGHYSILWVYGLMSLTAPYGYIIVGKVLLGLYESTTKSRERRAYEDTRRQAAMQLTSREDMQVRVGANLSNNGFGDSSVGILSLSVFFLMMAGYGILLLTKDGYICEEMKTTSLYFFAQFAVVVQMGMAINITYMNYNARPAYIRWQLEYDQKMREAFQTIPPDSPASADDASTTASWSESCQWTHKTTQMMSGRVVYTVPSCHHVMHTLS